MLGPLRCCERGFSPIDSLSAARSTLEPFIEPLKSRSALTAPRAPTLSTSARVGPTAAALGCGLPSEAQTNVQPLGEAGEGGAKLRTCHIARKHLWEAAKSLTAHPRSHISL